MLLMRSCLETLMRPEFKLRPDHEPPTEPASQAWSRQPVDHVSSSWVDVRPFSKMCHFDSCRLTLGQ